MEESTPPDGLKEFENPTTIRRTRYLTFGTDNSQEISEENRKRRNVYQYIKNLIRVRIERTRLNRELRQKEWNEAKRKERIETIESRNRRLGQKIISGT